LALREAAWVLHLSFSVLSHWNQGFDENMRPLKVPEKRGKSAKITVEMVKEIIRAAESLKSQGKRLRLQGFTKRLAIEHGIYLSRKKVREVLIANNQFAARTRKRQPRFYQSLRKEIPNGLLSLDGSEFTVWLDDEAYKFNVELAVDVGTFSHTAFSIAETETSDEVLSVIEAHCKQWGCPLGILCDSGSANLSETTKDYLDAHGIEPVPVGPSNPKGNGTDEGAFSQMKQALGTIRLDMSSLRALARSVLEKILAVYIHMRNRLTLRANSLPPMEEMRRPVSLFQRDLERQKLKEHNKAKVVSSEEDRRKLDRLHALIRYHGIAVEPPALKRAENSIKAFEMEAIRATEEAFIKAVNRKAGRMSLAYFFGILKRIQQERDDEAYRRYCHDHYNDRVMTELNRHQQQDQRNEHTVSDIVNMLVSAVNGSVQFVKELAIRKACQWTQTLMESYRYPGALKKQFADALGILKNLSLDQKKKIWELIEQFLNSKTRTESVTRFF
jgi:hypothetical protein